ncbi:MAG TPA: stage V sporulation protein D [Spirochaetes bacterium]|nr:stage V sporulation protein D [Spirochaetota bacterium]
MDIRLKRRFRIIIVFIVIIFSVLILRIINLMFFKKDTIFSPPGTPTYSERGFIVDRNGVRLALSLETYSVYARPSEVEQKKDTAEQLAAALEKEYEDILERLNRKRPFVWVQRQVDLKYAEKLEEINIKGIYLEKEYKRYYPENSLLSHTIGFSGVDNKGLEGIEYFLDDILLPKRIDNKRIDYPAQRRGYTIVLTIDKYIQEIVEEEIEKAWKQTGANLITVIVMDPSTGEIMALANKPDYDLNNFGKYPETTIRNKAITDSFEPGSTFKIFIAAILLDLGLVRENSIFICKGSVEVEGITIRDTAVHGRVTYRKVLEKSCNVGMVKSVKNIDNITLYEKLRSFGFGTPTGINLPGEARGLLRTPKKWSRVSKYFMAIGQEISVTPLQLITAASSLANKGVLMQPRIIKRLENHDGTILKKYPPLKIRRVIEEETAEKILDILTGVLSENGTGYKAMIEGYNIGGKTGTAQIADTQKGGYLEGEFYASFVGFLPVPYPEIVVLVTLDRPLGEVYGGQTAAPIFKNIVERIAPHLNILPSFSEIYVINDE